MIQSFFFPARLPGLNEMLAAARSHRGKWQAYDRLKKQLQWDMVVTIKRAKLKPMVGPVEIIYSWHEPNQKRDVDNLAAGKKFINDALVQAKILQTDGWAQVRAFQDHFCLAEKAGVYVTIKPWTP